MLDGMIPDDSRKLLLVQRCGPVAARVLQASATATVAAVFERSFYIEADGQFACIGSNCIGDGPLNAIVSETSLSSTLATIVPSQKIALSSHERSAVIQLDALRAVIWRPSIWPTTPVDQTAHYELGSAFDFARRHAPHDGLSRLVMGIARGDELRSPLHRVAAPSVAHLETWLSHGLSPIDCKIPPPVDLLGLGPGLTPSGDDVLGGLMIALDAIGATALRTSLAHTVLQAARQATSPLSAAFLAAAAEGFGSAALHDFICAVASGANTTAIQTQAEKLTAIGHTSGWDAMAGAMLALSAATTSKSS